MIKGKVYIVGAGPGDPGLLTVKAKDLINKADVIVYDYLADSNLLSLAKANTKMIYVGKRGSHHTKEQVDINKILVNLAKKNKIVVRLKGGDPFVFGRGGEEAEVLAQNKIEFEIVPGITSAIAAPAYAGIPVTHRDIASSFAVITGHRKTAAGKIQVPDADTLVYLMGVENIQQIVKTVIESGKNKNTPVALISWGTKSNQQTLVGTLSDIVAKSKIHKFKPPAITVIGNVVKLRNKLKWFENKPLFGKKILVTRTRHQASKLSKLLYDHGADVVEFPTIEVIPTSAKLPNLDKYDWIIFTSENGVKFFIDKINDIRELYGKKICAIGPATAQALKDHKIKVDLIPSEYQAEGIIAAFSKLNIAGKTILIPRAQEARGVLEFELKNMGANVDVLPIYKTIKPKQKINIDLTKIDIITFTSSSTVTNFMGMIGKKTKIKAKVACIGPITADTAKSFGLKVVIMAKENTIESMVKAIINDRRN